jgi:hypothetical protein
LGVRDEPEEAGRDGGLAFGSEGGEVKAEAEEDGDSASF